MYHRGMNTRTKVIYRDGHPTWVLIPYEEYLRLVEQIEMLEDIQDYNRIKAAVESGAEETFTQEQVMKSLGITDADLASVDVEIETSANSPLDVPGVSSVITKSEIVDAIRESRGQDIRERRQ